MRFDFTDKRVLVTGDTRVFGNAVVNAFNETGALVAINGRTLTFTPSANYLILPIVYLEFV